MGESDSGHGGEVDADEAEFFDGPVGHGDRLVGVIERNVHGSVGTSWVSRLRFGGLFVVFAAMVAACAIGSWAVSPETTPSCG